MELSFKEYDDRYTAPLHGFKNAEDYWHRCSSRSFIPNVRIPTLIVNALDDPFLAGECYPFKTASESPWVFLETPSSGGHVGFIQFNGDKSYWSENRAIDFIQRIPTLRKVGIGEQNRQKVFHHPDLDR